ncbi:TIGR01777 family oxidoreductase [Geofilum rubicundum]|uniref:Cell division inhibitor n=1 Tax=Geofilum rubicundum JCM 15548 TaxID=1236989 RepID=A0A0E9M0U3_9BACT|nr:TIGR01777 family oxidoreductase [Geofilum rubicundum]GAO31422.1 cell division inhibitor [Geofilum rubicundum JCM 15548]
MRVAICGITGLIGQAVKTALQSAGYIVVGVSRQDLASGTDHLKKLLHGTDAVVNLAGAPILTRWTESNKKKIYHSRIDTTRLLVEAINALSSPPKDFISASAVGIYDDVNVHDEFSTNYSSDFLSKVCRDWENEALKVNADKVRLSIFRLGIVLTVSGGALEQMLLPFKWGLGGKIGSGKQFFPWIHLEDVVSAIVGGITIPRASGVYNLVAPELVTNQQFTHQLARALRRPAFFMVPVWVLKLVFGEGATALTTGQQVIPQRLLADGFEFSYPSLNRALKTELT